MRFRLRSVTKKGTITTTRGKSCVNSTDHRSVLRPGKRYLENPYAPSTPTTSAMIVVETAMMRVFRKPWMTALLFNAAMKWSKVMGLGIHCGGKEYWFLVNFKAVLRPHKMGVILKNTKISAEEYTRAYLPTRRVFLA